ncbi:hypothetical protein [Streptomyces sp. AP-93]|uniref:hypothetical protein n=1 Tax=Streptomyces sp. AP-93 TaxID=2929048 RepID=UPI0035AFE486
MARTGASRHQLGHARWKFLTWCADADIPEVRTLATTVDRWWSEIATFIATGPDNARSEWVKVKCPTGSGCGPAGSGSAR